MARSPGLDPRGGDDEQSVRPVVAMPGSGLPAWVIGVGILLAALLLFSVLDARRRSASAPAVQPRDADRAGVPIPVAPLYIPPAPVPVPTATPTPPPPAPPPPPPPPRIIYMPQPVPMPPPVAIQPPRPRGTADAALVVDTTTGDAAGPPAAGGAEAAAAGGGGGSASAARATVMRHRPTTVPQGTLIPAVLETALDSTRPGPARALVSRDVRGFDGSRVLIQRGSRLIGEYRADLQPGQNRALVTWTRLVRPDGVTIAIGSPAADPLGRVGIKGKVNTHFLERFGGAILQSALDIGVNLASQAGNGTSAVVVALPGAAQATTSLTSSSQVQPTLTVRQGTAISVFVARDLDFTSVESKR